MKNKLILATLYDSETKTTETSVFYSWAEYYSTVFRPIKETYFLTDFEIKGKTYKERKENAQQIAIDYSNNDNSGLSWGELLEIQQKFESIGKNYGLLKEFKENAIC